MQIVRLDEDGWFSLREARLRALADAPSAFWATHADEAAYSEEQWRGFARAATWFLARRDGLIDGLAAGLIRAEAGDEPEVISVWVEPGARRRGTAAALVSAIKDWARELGAPSVMLWVTEDNTPAEHLYLRLGFEFTGERMKLPRDRAITEARMRAPLVP